MESLQLACLLSCKACPILPKLGPSLGFRPLRQVGFGSLWRNQTEYGCLMARSSANMGGGGSGGVAGNYEWSSDVQNEKEVERGLPLGPESSLIGFNLVPPGMSTGNGEIGEAEAEVSESKQENVGDNQLKEIRVELRKNNEEIKKLRETVQNSYWKLLRKVVLDQKMYTESNRIQEVALNKIDRPKEEQQHKIETGPEPPKDNEGGKENENHHDALRVVSNQKVTKPPSPKNVANACLNQIEDDDWI